MAVSRSVSSDGNQSLALQSCIKNICGEASAIPIPPEFDSTNIEGKSEFSKTWKETQTLIENFVDKNAQFEKSLGDNIKSAAQRGPKIPSDLSTGTRAKVSFAILMRVISEEVDKNLQGEPSALDSESQINNFAKLKSKKIAERNALIFILSESRKIMDQLPSQRYPAKVVERAMMALGSDLKSTGALFLG